MRYGRAFPADEARGFFDVEDKWLAKQEPRNHEGECNQARCNFKLCNPYRFFVGMRRSELLDCGSGSRRLPEGKKGRT